MFTDAGVEAPNGGGFRPSFGPAPRLRRRTSGPERAVPAGGIRPRSSRKGASGSALPDGAPSPTFS